MWNGGLCPGKYWFERRVSLGRRVRVSDPRALAWPPHRLSKVVGHAPYLVRAAGLRIDTTARSSRRLLNASRALSSALKLSCASRRDGHCPNPMAVLRELAGSENALPLLLRDWL